ncbi:hypothetical protein INT45_013932 [Circinella minor]|uniref:Uncharacterized protein n=1 Tax=Circinella minor TaxID=1195481 RepID=A0A8H7S456_9FUNG|nr:hypothetical protein INT45_013932 [Circinella minor]
MEIIEEVIEKYVLDRANEPLSLEKFLKDNREFIASKMNLGENYKEVWAGHFIKIMRKNNLAVAKSKEIDWGVITTAYFEYLSKNLSKNLPSQASSSRSDQPSSSICPTSSGAATNNSIPKLKNEDYKKFEDMFESLVKEKFWILSTGTVVEEKMKELGMKLNTEHPCHSMILDTTDPVWLDYFTEIELEEIEREKQVAVSELPSKIKVYLDNYKDLKTLDSLWNEYTKHNFHPINDNDLYWVHSSVRNVLEILMHGLHKKFKTEADLMKRAWLIIDCCFDNDDLDAISGEYVSKASSARANLNRSLAALSRRKIGTKTDILFTTEYLEFGTVEAGKISDVNNSKTLYEAGMKLPKNLKDMQYDLVQECPSQCENIKTCGIIISGKFISTLKINTMVFPASIL